MSRELKLKVGDSVVVKIERGSNAARRMVKMTLENQDEWLFDGVVTSAGRKYITVEFRRYYEEKFVIENDYRQKYTCGGADYKLYSSRQEALDEIESENLYDEIRSMFSAYRNNNKFTLEQLRNAKAILEGEDAGGL